MIPEGFARLHADAHRHLSAWTAPDEASQVLRRRYLAHLAAHPDAMWRDGPPDHFTAGVFIFDHTLERVLLVLHKKAGLWLQVGGHFEAEDDTVAAAAHREATEESGLTELQVTPRLVDLDHHRLASAFGRCRSHLDLRFAGIAPEGATPVVSDESDGIGWWPVDALPDPTDPHLPHVVRTVRERVAR